MLTFVLLIASFLLLSSCYSTTSHSSSGSSRSSRAENNYESANADQGEYSHDDSRKGPVKQVGGYPGENSNSRSAIDLPQGDEAVDDDLDLEEVKGVIDCEEDLSQGRSLCAPDELSYSAVPFGLIFSDKGGINFNLLKKAFVSHSFYNGASRVDALNLPVFGGNFGFNISSFGGDGFFFENSASIKFDRFNLDFEASYLRENNWNLLNKKEFFHNFTRESYMLKTFLKFNFNKIFYSILSPGLTRTSFRGDGFNSVNGGSLDGEISFYFGVNESDGKRFIAGFSKTERDSYKIKMMAYTKISNSLSAVFSAAGSKNSKAFLIGLSSVSS